MNKSFASHFSCYQGLCFPDEVEFVEDKLPDLTQGKLQEVLDEIFSVDPISGFPRGDIQYFLSKDGNPQVKAWLESNLLQPRAQRNGTSIDGVTDELIAEFAKNPNEDFESYATRIASIRDEAMANIEKLKVSR